MATATRTADSVLKLMKREPKRSGASHPGARHAALRYTLTITPAANRSWELQALLGDLPGFDLSHAKPSRFSITHSQHWTRTDIDEQGMAGKNVTYTEHPDGGFTYADHTDKFYFNADKEQAVPLAPPAPISASVEVEPGEPIDGRPTQVATVQMSAPTPVRLRIWFVEPGELKAYARAVFTRLVGCPDRLSKAGMPVARLEELGLPVRMESYSSSFGNGDEPLVTSTITDLHLGHTNTKDFEVPHGYHNLRDTEGLSQKVGPQGFKAGTGQIADSRPGYTDYTGSANPAPSNNVQADILSTNTGRLRIPQCLPSTFAAQIAVDTDQVLYDDLRFIINNVFSRLSSFNGSSGTLLVDWLNQWAQSPNVGSGDDGLYCMLRDPADFTQNPPYLGGNGLLDKLAERQARSAMVDGSITSIGLSLPPALLAQVTIALSQPPNARFDSLSAVAQAQLRELYLTQLIGQFTVTYPTSTSPSTTFYGLMNIQLSDIEFSININYTQPMTSLDVDNNAIKMHLALPSVRGNANIARWPTGLYWAVLGISGLACLFLPFLCTLVPFIAAAGAFLLSDYAYVRVEIDNFTADATISFQPDAMQVLRPQVVIHLNGDVSVWYMSYIPTGIQQLASFVYSLVGSHTQIVINAIESQLQDSLNKLFTKTLNLSFPPQFGPVPIVGIDSSTDGKLDDFLYLEAGLDAGLVGISAPYITQVGSDIEAPFLAGRLQNQNDAAGHPMSRGYGGFVVSQNLLNYYINSIWRNGAFNYTLSPAEVHSIALALAPLVHLKKPVLNIHIWPAVTPRTVLTPYGDYKQNTYAATFFDDLRLCISLGDQKEGSTVELQFAAEAFTQIGLGAVDTSASPPKLDIIRVTDTFLDLYFDLTRLRVRLIHPVVQGVQTTGPAFSTLTVAKLPLLQGVMLAALQFALQSRDDQFIPSPTGDPKLQQYAIPGGTIDIHLTPNRGNIYAWIGLSGTPKKILSNTYYGILAVFPNGPLDITTMNCITGKLLAAVV